MNKYNTVFQTGLFFAFAAILFSFLLAFLLTPLARKLAFRFRCLDMPDGKRKMHKAPVPYFGGLSILVGFAVSALVFSFLTMGMIPTEISVILTGAAAICLVGLLDDVFDIRPGYKLLAQLAVASFTVGFGGGIEYTTIWGLSLHLGALSFPVTVFWIVLIVNAVNLIDGLDGLAGGVCAMESFALLVMSLVMGNPVCAVASAAICGASLGFLPYNINGATIFMGDAGSMLIGYVMACISVFGLFKSQALFSIVVPALIFALPVMDTVLAFFRRIVRGRNPFRADKQHLHHKLLDNGFSPCQSVLAIYVASAVFCIASVLYMYHQVISVSLCVMDLAYLEALKNDRLFLRGIKTSADTAEMLLHPNGNGI
ncbi:MAG: undecaprenyl/decaprenyl-phosphate alpha-N-acetylglucosaminyl 1-phosphate transferase [Clostridia bacterium]|nr:undecaprenyl/decaprenyl-phosphate alpha-N-acetylglucosaminyl 1-phosphate transferase [Clostridia bacterium]